MASQTSLILRNAAARERLNRAVAQLRKSGVAVPEPSLTGRDAAVAASQELEYFADAFESVNDFLAKPKAEPIKAAAPKAKAEPTKAAK